MALLPPGTTDTGLWVSSPVVAQNTESDLPQKSHRDVSGNEDVKQRGTDAQRGEQKGQLTELCLTLCSCPGLQRAHSTHMQAVQKGMLQAWPATRGP